ncbi:hypothetical protein VKT23_001875 [Stygiomarasmius scandens]|uniref:DUF4219 domain-containing protein n=1 Tax=Marasmiellus scandens TaxID=2682957 RepID=A0ABR1K3X9_9AGAR
MSSNNNSTWSHLVTLDTRNWKKWSQLMKAYLQSNECWEAVEKTKDEYCGTSPQGRVVHYPAVPAQPAIAPQPAIPAQAAVPEGPRQQAQPAVEGRPAVPGRPAVQGSPAHTETIPPSASKMESYNKKVSEYTKMNGKARGLILSKVSMDMYQYVKDNAKDAWNELKTKYGTPSTNLIVQKLVNLLKFHIPNKSNPVLAVDKFKESYDDIFEKDVIEISELICVVFVLNALPNSWDSFKQQKMATDIKTLTFNQLQNAISDEYERRRAFNDLNNQNTQQVAANKAKFSGIKHGSSNHSWRNQRDNNQTPGNNQNQGGFNANSNANNKGKQRFQSAPPLQNTSNSNPQNKNQNKSKKPYKKWNKRQGQGGQTANNATIDDPDFGEIPVACMASIDAPDDPSELPQDTFEPTTSSNNQNPRFYNYCMSGHLNCSENATHCHFGHRIGV